MFSEEERAHFSTFGFVVARQVFDARALAEEMERSLAEGHRAGVGLQVGGEELRFRYLPMMSARTPASLALLVQLAGGAASLLAGPILPTRAKGVVYAGATAWHRDSDAQLDSVGFAAYLEPLDSSNGALQVVPGSHRGELAAAIASYLARGGPRALPGYAIATSPGDVIAFDEHLFHASAGGRNRRQWRVDYVADPVSPPPGHEARLRQYYQGLFPTSWEGGYDVERFPSYGADWRRSGLPWVARLEQLGVYAAAEAHERR